MRAGQIFSFRDCDPAHSTQMPALVHTRLEPELVLVCIFAETLAKAQNRGRSCLRAGAALLVVLFLDIEILDVHIVDIVDIALLLRFLL